MTSAAFELPGAEAVEYRRTPQGVLHLHVFRPDGYGKDDPRPGIVFFFGGGWRNGSPAQFAPFCEALAARGMVAVSAEYRVAERHGTPPKACIADGKSAVRFLRSHATEMGIDPARLAAGGGSAGGHVAVSTALLSIDEDGTGPAVSCVPDALVLFNPVLDTTPTGWEGALEQLEEESREDYSPVHHVAGGTPPSIVFHGEADDVVPVENTRRFAERMRAEGNRCELHTYAGQGHGFFNKGRDGDRWYDATLSESVAFLVSLGWIV